MCLPWVRGPGGAGMGARMDEAFAELLRGYRLAAGLTQEALAERAGLGVRSVQALEGGDSRPQRDTLRRLVDALALGEGERARLLAAGTPVPRRRSAPSVAAHPQPRPPAPRHNLPLALTELIGREAERSAVLALLTEARLVMLLGSGGVGKTRLALAVASELVDRYPDGVWLVELAALAEGRLVARTVLETLGTREEGDRPWLETLTEHLREKGALLVLDNCEHLVGACAALAETVLRRCPGVRVLATSREALAVAGERRYRVPSLPVPNLAHLPPPERLAEAAAVTLFVERARERRPEFALTAQNARAVAEVCARLDGIPLAIELAAARVDSLGVEGIAARLDDRFRLLTGGPRTALPRQRTLRAALDWSYELLTASEQLLLDRLSVFAGGGTLAAAEAICAGVVAGDPLGADRPGGYPRAGDPAADSLGRQRGDGIEGGEVLDLLGNLVSKSLVQVETRAGGEVRYGLLETVRQYGRERLATAGAAEVVHNRHLAWYLSLAEELMPQQWGATKVTWLDRLEADHDNLRAALRWARERGAAEEGLRLAGALAGYWGDRCYLSEGLSWLEDALARDTGGTAARARALAGAGDLMAWQGNFGRGAALLEESLGLYRALGDSRGIALTLNQLGAAVERHGDCARATTLQEESLVLFRTLEEPVGVALALTELGRIAWVRGEYGRAVSHYEESLAYFREVGARDGVAYSLSNLACVLDRCGAHARAVALQEDALALMRDMRNPAGIAWSLVNLGWSLLALGEVERATALTEESQTLARNAGHYWGVPRSLMCLGWAAYLRGENERAVALQEQALALFQQVNYRWDVIESLVSLGYVLQARGEYGRAAASLREALAGGREIGARGRLAEALEGTAWLAVATGSPERAARLGGAAEALREALGAALHPVLHAGHERATRAMRDALGEAAFTAAWAEGRALPSEEAVSLALANAAEARDEG